MGYKKKRSKDSLIASSIIAGLLLVSAYLMGKPSTTYGVRLALGNLPACCSGNAYNPKHTLPGSESWHFMQPSSCSLYSCLPGSNRHTTSTCFSQIQKDQWVDHLRTVFLICLSIQLLKPLSRTSVHHTCADPMQLLH